MKKVVKKWMGFVCAVVISVMCFSVVSVHAEEGLNEQNRLNPNGVITRRALVVSAPIANGIYDIEWQGMRNLFQRNSITTTCKVFESREGYNDFYATVTSTFANADGNDVSYIYINSHGYDNRLELDGTGHTISYNTLKRTFDAIEGNVVLMIDACYSGESIARGESVLQSNDNLPQRIIESFFGCEREALRSGAFSGSSKYVVYCSCREEEKSYCPNDCSAAAYSWANTAGYAINLNGGSVIGSSISWNEFSPANQVLSAGEFFTQSSAYMSDYLAAYASQMTTSQTMCYYTPSIYRTVFSPNYDLGDVNQDYCVDALDITALRDYVSGSNSLSARSIQLADLTQDGSVNLQDVLALRQFTGREI